jgi:hypothetical protein
VAGGCEHGSEMSWLAERTVNSSSSLLHGVGEFPNVLFSLAKRLFNLIAQFPSQ